MVLTGLTGLGTSRIYSTPQIGAEGLKATPGQAVRDLPTSEIRRRVQIHQGNLALEEAEAPVVEVAAPVGETPSNTGKRNPVCCHTSGICPTLFPSYPYLPRVIECGRCAVNTLGSLVVVKLKFLPICFMTRLSEPT